MRAQPLSHHLERRAVDEAVLYEADPGERRDRLHYGYRRHPRAAKAGRLPGQCHARLPALSRDGPAILQ
jgi:hypothetical protein